MGKKLLGHVSYVMGYMLWVMVIIMT